MTRRLILLLGIFAVMLGACASADEETTATSDYRDVSPGQVAGLDEGSEVRVTGILLITPESTRLCEAMMESYPPQCGEPAVELTGLTGDDVIGLSRPTEPGLADIVWSDFPVSVFGTVQGDAVAVTAVDQTIWETSRDGVLVRLSYHPDPLEADGAVAWVMDVANERAESLDLSFSTGQSAEVELSVDDVVAYRWSDEMMFTQAFRTVTLAPGERYGAMLPGTLTVEPGEYDVAGWFVANQIRDITVGGPVTVE